MATNPEAKPSPIAGLNKVQKLAALLVVLGPEEASVILSAFSQRQMEQIMAEMARIEFLSADVQHSLLEEFSSVTLEAVTSALGGVEKAQNVLEKSLGQAKAREVLNRVAPEATTSPMVEELRNMPAAAVAQLLRGEQPQTWALILAQLDHDACAEVFRGMDAALRADIMLRMARMEPVSPDVLERLLKGLLARRAEAASRDYVSADGTKFLTEIMKKFDRQAATDALNALAESDPRTLRLHPQDDVHLRRPRHPRWRHHGHHPARGRLQHAGHRHEGLSAEAQGHDPQKHHQARRRRLAGKPAHDGQRPPQGSRRRPRPGDGADLRSRTPRGNFPRAGGSQCRLISSCPSRSSASRNRRSPRPSSPTAPTPPATPRATSRENCAPRGKRSASNRSRAPGCRSSSRRWRTCTRNTRPSSPSTCPI
ncbi:MAG: hypothetical protein WDO13_05985 [Verrucomicrobiota bacterium]